MRRLLASVSTIALGLTPAFAQQTPGQNQQQINGINWLGSKTVTDAELQSLFTNINGTFGLYGSLAGPNTWTNTNTFLGPVTLPTSQALTSPVISGGLTQNGVVIDVRAPPYNAKCDGTTDDAAAINAALTAAAALSPAGLVLIPDATCRAASTISVPRLVNLAGAVFNPSNPPTGSVIKCDLSVTPCVTGGGNNGTVRVEKLSITHAAGTPSSGTVGLQIADAYNAVVNDVMVYNSGLCYQFLAHPATGLGLGAVMNRTFSGACSDAHIDVNGWPELRINQSRFGMDGNGDYASNAFIRVEGGVSGTAGGPNTIVAENSQFNQGGGNAVFHWLEFVNLGSGGVPAIDATDFKFNTLHVEGINGADIYSDSSWNLINRLSIENSSFNDVGTAFFSLNSATQTAVVQLIAAQIAGPLSLTAPSGHPMTAFTQIGGSIGGSETLTGVAGSTATVSNVAFYNGLTVAGTWTNLSVGPDTYVGGGFINSVANTSGVYVNSFESLNVSLSTPINVNALGQHTLLNLTGVETGDYVQENILNNGGGTASARTQWQTSISNGYAIFGVSNLTGSTMQAQYYAGSAVVNLDFLNSGSATTTFHNGANLIMTIAPGMITAGVPVQVPSSTVASLPTCGAGLAGGISYVTDANAPTYNGTLTGGSTTKTLAMCNGSAWVAH